MSGSLVPNQMRYQTALHPDLLQVYDFIDGNHCLAAGFDLANGNGIAPNGMDGNPEFPEKFPWRSRCSMISSFPMLPAMICAAFGFFCAPGQAPGQNLTRGPVEVVSGVAVTIDGDSLRVAGTEIRLQAIDAPEMGQMCGEAGRTWPCGVVAKRRVGEIIGAKDLTCRTGADDVRDRYGRFLGFCVTLDGIDINLEMVRSGYARAFTRYIAGKRHQAAYEAAEAEARQLRRGIWSGPHQAPWDFRAAKRETE